MKFNEQINVIDFFYLYLYSYDETIPVFQKGRHVQYMDNLFFYNILNNK